MTTTTHTQPTQPTPQPTQPTPTKEPKQQPTKQQQQAALTTALEYLTRTNEINIQRTTKALQLFDKAHTLKAISDKQHKIMQATLNADLAQYKAQAMQ
jgi:hypothetical protein